MTSISYDARAHAQTHTKLYVVLNLPILNFWYIPVCIAIQKNCTNKYIKICDTCLYVCNICLNCLSYNSQSDISSCQEIINYDFVYIRKVVVMAHF